MTIKIRSREVLKILSLTILFLILANLIDLILKLHFGHVRVKGFTTLFRLFNLNTECNIPTFFSSLLFVVCSVLQFIISGSRRSMNDPLYYRWFILGIIFLFLALDETVSIHETFREPFQLMFQTTGLLNYAWVIPYGIAVLMLSAIYAHFIYTIPSSIRTIFLSSALIYLSGVLGFEMLGGAYDESYGTNKIGYAMLYTVEEMLEMVGLVVFIYGLLRFIEDTVGGITIRIGY